MKKAYVRGMLIFYGMLAFIIIFAFVQDKNSSKSYIRHISGDKKALDQINLVYDPRIVSKDQVYSDVKSQKVFERKHKLTLFTSDGAKYIDIDKNSPDETFKYKNENYRLLHGKKKFNISLESNKLKIFSIDTDSAEKIGEFTIKNPDEFLYKGCKNLKELENSYISNLIENDKDIIGLVYNSNANEWSKDRFKAKMTLISYNISSKKFNVLNSLDIESTTKKDVKMTDLNASIYDAFGKVILVYKIDGKIHYTAVNKSNKKKENEIITDKMDKDYEDLEYLLQDNIEYEIKNQYYSEADKSLAIIYNKRGEDFNRIASYKLVDNRIKLISSFLTDNKANKDYSNVYYSKISNSNNGIKPSLITESKYYRLGKKFVIIDNVNLSVNITFRGQLFDKRYIIVQVYDIEKGELIYLGEIGGDARRESLFENINSNIMPSIKN